ncbi:MAG TPA: hypothetical protein VM287_00025 [Egibacteraceae bacterium]|nr:hypothetical protein [Egibacteraceae bacterium]
MDRVGVGAAEGVLVLLSVIVGLLLTVLPIAIGVWVLVTLRRVARNTETILRRLDETGKTVSDPKDPLAG